MHVHSFETHGIEMSDFGNLRLKNVKIGPSSNIAFLKAEDGYARFTCFLWLWHFRATKRNDDDTGSGSLTMVK